MISICSNMVLVRFRFSFFQIKVLVMVTNISKVLILEPVNFGSVSVLVCAESATSRCMSQAKQTKNQKVFYKLMVIGYPNEKSKSRFNHEFRSAFSLASLL